MKCQVRALSQGRRLWASTMNDKSTTVFELRELVRKFVDDREWEKFHAPKNVSMAIAIEAAELMEHFQWLSVEESRSIDTDRAKLDAVGEELADIICYTLALANTLGLDVTETMHAKMKKNEVKYPVQKYRGKFE